MKQYKTSVHLLHLFHPFLHFLIVLVMILQADRFMRISLNAEDTPARDHKIIQFTRGSRFHTFHFDQKKRLISTWTIAQAPLFHLGIPDDRFGNIIATAAVFMDRFPYQCLIHHVGGRGERFVLHPQRTPHIGHRMQDGNVGIHGTMLQNRSQASFIGCIILEIRPPVVILVIISPITNPSGERSFFWRIVETVENRMCHTRDSRLVATDLQQLQCHIEHGISVRHLLTTHQAFSTQMGGR